MNKIEKIKLENNPFWEDDWDFLPATTDFFPAAVDSLPAAPSISCEIRDPVRHPASRARFGTPCDIQHLVRDLVLLPGLPRHREA